MKQILGMCCPVYWFCRKRRRTSRVTFRTEPFLSQRIPLQ